MSSEHKDFDKNICWSKILSFGYTECDPKIHRFCAKWNSCYNNSALPTSNSENWHSSKGIILNGRLGIDAIYYENTILGWPLNINLASSTLEHVVVFPLPWRPTNMITLFFPLVGVQALTPGSTSWEYHSKDGFSTTHLGQKCLITK